MRQGLLDIPIRIFDWSTRVGSRATWRTMSPELARVLGEQSGVITRLQLQQCGVAKPQLDRMLRRKDLVRMLPGVFLNHTGEPTWLQRAWAGTLFYEPAALGKESALRAVNGPGRSAHDETAPIAIAVDQDQRVMAQPGYRICRHIGLAERVQWNASPPRMRVEEAVLDVAAERASELDAVEVLADACRSRHTTASRLSETLKRRNRIARRDWLSAVLADIGDGTCSVLEHGYLQLIERAHGLPRSRRQVASAGSRGRIYHDVEYEEFGLHVELDGRLFHDNPRQRNRDLDRDLDNAVGGRMSVRLGWGQVYGSTCHTTSHCAATGDSRLDRHPNRM